MLVATGVTLLQFPGPINEKDNTEKKKNTDDSLFSVVMGQNGVPKYLNPENFIGMGVVW